MTEQVASFRFDLIRTSGGMKKARIVGPQSNGVYTQIWLKSLKIRDTVLNDKHAEPRIHHEFGTNSSGYLANEGIENVG
jgi:hypothetical protein